QRLEPGDFHRLHVDDRLAMQAQLLLRDHAAQVVGQRKAHRVVRRPLHRCITPKNTSLWRSRLNLQNPGAGRQRATSRGGVTCVTNGRDSPRAPAGTARRGGRRCQGPTRTGPEAAASAGAADAAGAESAGAGTAAGVPAGAAAASGAGMFRISDTVTNSKPWACNSGSISTSARYVRGRTWPMPTAAPPWRARSASRRSWARMASATSAWSRTTWLTAEGTAISRATAGPTVAAVVKLSTKNFCPSRSTPSTARITRGSMVAREPRWL